MKTIIVLGGTGFVGRHLCAALTQQGHTVRVLSRNPEKAKAMTVLPTLTIKKVDVYQQSELNAACKNADVVINLIGILNEEGSKKGAGFRQAHVTLAQKVIQACVNNAVPRLLHMSALNADPTKGSSYYLRTKGEAESYVHRYANADIHVTSFRPSVIFGPGDSFLNRFACLLNYAPGFVLLPAADSLYAPVYVGDVVSAMIASLDNAKTFGQRYELCGPQVYTLKTLVTYVAHIKHSKCLIIGLSPLWSKVLAGVMECFPGKPFSRDNYLSTRIPSVCKEPFPAVFGITPKTLESIAPVYLQANSKQQLLDSYRRQVE
jgi:NADH dehydrogenase